MSGTGWVQIYRCWCSDSAMDAMALPVVCPGHQTRVLQRVENKFDGGVPDRHECADRPCPDGPVVVVQKIGPGLGGAPASLPVVVAQ